MCRRASTTARFSSRDPSKQAWGRWGGRRARLPPETKTRAPGFVQCPEWGRAIALALSTLSRRDCSRCLDAIALAISSRLRSLSRRDCSRYLDTRALALSTRLLSRSRRARSGALARPIPPPLPTQCRPRRRSIDRPPPKNAVSKSNCGATLQYPIFSLRRYSIEICEIQHGGWCVTDRSYCEVSKKATYWPEVGRSVVRRARPARGVVLLQAAACL